VPAPEAAASEGRVLARGLVRVEHERFEACRPEMRQLVVLQRDQRRDDDRRPGPQEPGELVDGRLPASGRQHREDVAPFGGRGSRAQLSRAKPAEPEAVSRELADPPRRPGSPQRYGSSPAFRSIRLRSTSTWTSTSFP